MKDSLSSLAMVTLTMSCGPILTLCTNAALISNECKITVYRLFECLHVHMYVHVNLIIIHDPFDYNHPYIGYLKRDACNMHVSAHSMHVM